MPCRFRPPGATLAGRLRDGLMALSLLLSIAHNLAALIDRLVR
jgi:hypothetical protein